MVPIGLTVNSHVDGIYRVYSLLTCGWYLESLQCTHVWMVLKVYSILTCGWYLESLQSTHVWMVFRELTVYSHVDVA